MLGVERVHLVLHDFGGPIGLVWAAMHADARGERDADRHGHPARLPWHSLARIWRTPVLGELFQATATRARLPPLLNRNEPRGLPREFVEEMYDHYDRRTRRAVLELYRATDDPGAAARVRRAAWRRSDIPALVIWGEHDAYLPSSLRGAPARRVPLGRRARAAGERPLALRRRAGDGRAAAGRIPPSAARPRSAFRARPGLGRLDLAVLRRRRGDQGVEQSRVTSATASTASSKASAFGPRGLGQAADLAHVLQRGGLDLLLGRGWIQVVEGSDVSAHASILDSKSARFEKSRGAGYEIPPAA